MNPSETIDNRDVPAGLNWLSERQREQPLPLPISADPLLNYCLELEARIDWQTGEISALRQMLRSEHGRHLRGTRIGKPRISWAWLRSLIGLRFLR